MLTRLKAILAITLIVTLIDHGTKYAAWTFLRSTQPQSYFADTLRLSYHENPGAFLSLGATLPPLVRTLIFTGLVSIFLIYLLYFLLTDNNLSRGAVNFGGLMFAGGIGNLIDRIFFEGGVIDFLNVGIGSLRTGIFNVADMAILAGVVGFFILGRPTLETPVQPNPKENEKVIENDSAY
ncbi:MAG: signal peptidase II [Anaerolineae bacterium]